MRLSILSIGFLVLLSGCGGKDDPPAQTAMAQNAQGNYCAPETAASWRELVASRCRFARDSRAAQRCVRGVEVFRRQNPGIDCVLSAQDAQWGPGDGSQVVTINERILSRIARHYGVGYRHGQHFRWR